MTRLEKSYNERQEQQRQDWIKKQIQLHKKFIDVKNSSYVQRPKKVNFIAVVVTVAVLFIVLLVIASFFDKQITSALSSWALPKQSGDTLDLTDGKSISYHLGRLYSTSIFANAVELIGAFPLMLALTAALAVIFWSAFRIKNKGGRITLQVVTVLIAFGYIFYRGYGAFFPHLIESIIGVQGYNEFHDSNKGACYAIFICGALVMCGAIIPSFYVPFRQIKAETLSQMLRWSMATLLAILVSTILFEFVIKNLIVRERFRFIYALEQYQTVNFVDENGIATSMSGVEFSDKYFGGYKDWYVLASTHLPDKKIYFMYKDAIRSFPSGHSSSAATGLLCLFMLPLTVKACNTYKTKMCIWSICPILWIAVVVGRMVAGAHYLSDTMFGSLLGVAFLLVFYFVVTWSCRFFDKWTNLQIYPYLKWEINKQNRNIKKH